MPFCIGLRLGFRLGLGLRVVVVASRLGMHMPFRRPVLRRCLGGRCGGMYRGRGGLVGRSKDLRPEIPRHALLRLALENLPCSQVRSPPSLERFALVITGTRRRLRGRSLMRVLGCGRALARQQGSSAVRRDTGSSLGTGRHVTSMVHRFCAVNRWTGIHTAENDAIVAMILRRRSLRRRLGYLRRARRLAGPQTLEPALVPRIHHAVHEVCQTCALRRTLHGRQDALLLLIFVQHVRTRPRRATRATLVVSLIAFAAVEADRCTGRRRGQKQIATRLVLDDRIVAGRDRRVAARHIRIGIHDIDLVTPVSFLAPGLSNLGQGRLRARTRIHRHGHHGRKTRTCRP